MDMGTGRSATESVANMVSAEQQARYFRQGKWPIVSNWVIPSLT